MRNKVPAYIIKDLEKLNKHLNAVAELAGNIESWVEKIPAKMVWIFSMKIILTCHMNLILTIPKLNWKES